MPFRMEGTFRGKILAVKLAEARFAEEDPNAFDVCIMVEGPDGQSDWWRGEMSRKYGRGNFANKTQSQITMENLNGIGFEGLDVSTLEKQLVGKEIGYTVKSRDYVNKEGQPKTAYEVKYLGESDYAPKAIDPSTLAARMAALGLGAPSGTTAATAAPKQPATAPAAQPATDDGWC